jgi:hypothetical protein
MTKKKAYFLLLILLFFSGNPLMTFLFGKFTMAVALVLTFLLIHKNIQLDKQFFTLFKIIILGIFAIGAFQLIELHTVSWLGMLNLATKFLLGGIIANTLKDRFNWMFFKVVSDLSVLSLIFYILINLLKIKLPSISLGEEINSYIIYGTSYEQHMLKNAGMFWEPGAHAGILTLNLALNFNNLKYYWAKHKYRLIAVILALLTAQSTTGYLVGFIIFLFFFINKKTVILIPIFLIIAFYVYQSTSFLSEKIESQFEESQNQKIGEVSNTRFGSAIFDWYYIQNHPLIGNGLEETTRYAKHKYLFVGEKGDVIGSGNGFTGTLASMGILYVLAYFYFLWRAIAIQNKIYALLVLLAVVLNLQGEQWLNFPLYLGLPFLTLKPIGINRRPKIYKKVHFSLR